MINCKKNCKTKQTRIHLKILTKSVRTKYIDVSRVYSKANSLVTSLTMFQNLKSFVRHVLHLLLNVRLTYNNKVGNKYITLNRVVQIFSISLLVRE